jgi:hypothetical protein
MLLRAASFSGEGDFVVAVGPAGVRVLDSATYAAATPAGASAALACTARGATLVDGSSLLILSGGATSSVRAR